MGVSAGDGVHDGHPDARALEAADGTHRLGEGSGLTEVVVRGLEAVERELVLAAAKRLHARADLVVQMEGVAHDAPHESALVQQLGKAPEVGVQDRVTTRDVEVGLAAEAVTQLLGLVHDLGHPLPRHAVESRAVPVGKDIAVLAALIALVGDVPLEGKRRLDLRRIAHR